jgi:nicotinamidase-related amidase
MTLTTLDPATALVVIDLQRGVVGAPTRPSPAADVLARSVELAGAFRAYGLPVVLVRVTHRPDGSDAAPGRTESPRRTGPRPEGFDVLAEELAGEAHRNSVERIFPRLGETGTTADILALLGKTR